MIYVLAFPVFEPDLEHRIAAFRRTHEPERANLVGPHITLVFGLRAVEPLAFADACARAVSQTAEIKVAFSGSRVVHDPHENTYKIFLMVSTGKNQITRVHQSLYDNPLRAQLDPGCPYRPHMTVATHPDRSCLDAIDVGVLGDFPIRGVIRRIEVVELDAGQLRTIRTLAL